MSRDALSRQQFEFMFHATSPHTRYGIEREGLKVAYDEGEGYTEPGIYMSPRPSPYSGHDVWKVNTSGLKIHPDDPGQMHEFRDVGGSYFHKEDIPPERLRLHQKGDRE